MASSTPSLPTFIEVTPDPARQRTGGGPTNLKTYRELCSPYYRRVDATIYKVTSCKTFKRCDGSIDEPIPEFIEDGFEIPSPVQTSAAKIDPVTRKCEFGGRLVFWGGGVEAQTTLPFGNTRRGLPGSPRADRHLQRRRRLRVRRHRHPRQLRADAHEQAKV